MNHYYELIYFSFCVFTHVYYFIVLLTMLCIVLNPPQVVKVVNTLESLILESLTKTSSIELVAHAQDPVFTFRGEDPMAGMEKKEGE